MSRKRAEAVRDYLAGKGIARTAMTVIARGETRPIAPNARPDGSDDSAGRARNRRVEIFVGERAPQ
jgi:OOP family OmpA-OmpF porin